MEPMKSCFDCSYHKSSPTNLLGFCQWFKEKGQEPKEIPGKVVDKGCKYFIPKTEVF